LIVTVECRPAEKLKDLPAKKHCNVLRSPVLAGAKPIQVSDLGLREKLSKTKRLPLLVAQCGLAGHDMVEPGAPKQHVGSAQLL
jgi:hypothetical protein